MTSNPPNPSNSSNPSKETALAARIMQDFATRTGIVGDAPPKRYLWTDAFAVCNFLGLSLEQRDERALDLALRLVDQTHRVLGKHRPDDPREGWLSGLGEACLLYTSPSPRDPE